MAMISKADLASSLAGINGLSNEDLKELCNSESNEKYDEIVNKSDRVKSLEAEREMLMASVKSLAEFNLARQNEYEQNRSHLLSLVSDSDQLKDQIEQKAATLVELSRKSSLESTLAVVLASTAHAEEDSEEVARSFLAKNLDFDSFISQYCEKRKLAHLRRIKADRLRQETQESWTGITDSHGVIYDFGGSHYVAVDNFSFGRPTKLTRLDSSKARRNWDEAIKISARKFQEKSHNIVYQNCHSHVADTLNEMKYGGRSNWNQIDVWWLITSQSSYLGCMGFLKQWGLFLLISIIVILIVVITTV